MHFFRLSVVKYVAVLLALASMASAKQDVEGSSDHPLLTRYPGFTISKYSSVAFDKADIMAGPAYISEERKHALELMTVEGAVTNIKYTYSGEDISTYALFSNYRKAFEGLDAKMLLSCEGPEECGLEGVYINNLLNNEPAAYRGIRVDVPDDFAILTGVVTKGDTLAHIMVIVGTHHGTGRRYVNQSIITSAVLDTNKLGIGNLDDLTAGLAETGSIVLEGVLFDFDTTDLKQDSAPVLDILQQYLDSTPEVEVFIVGHTDNTGTYDYNVGLSRDRAAAVVDNLTKRGIAASRLTPIGIGPVSPVANNATADGQALNRRVELVVK